VRVFGVKLFYRSDGVDLENWLRDRLLRLRAKIEAIPRREFGATPSEELVNTVMRENCVRPLVLDLVYAKNDAEEVGSDFSLRASGHAGAIRSELRATKSIVFNGNRSLWHLRPTSVSGTVPYGDIQGPTIVIGVSVDPHESDAAVRHIEATILGIREHLECQEAQIARHNTSIRYHAMQWVQIRKRHRTAASDLVRRLGG